MYKNKKFLAIIPARSGSKGIPGKNVKKLGNKPLIAWSIAAARKSKYLDKVIVSTDSQRIALVARKYGANVPFMRPKKLSTDSARMMGVIEHVVGFALKNISHFDYLVLLQPTSPFRNSKHIDEAIELLFQKEAKAVLGVTEVEHPVQRCGTLPANGNLNDFYDKKFQKLNRQEFAPYYRLNGAIYVADIRFLLKLKKWFSKQTYAYVMDRRHSVDIDTIEDFLFAQTLLKHSLI